MRRLFSLIFVGILPAISAVSASGFSLQQYLNIQYARRPSLSPNGTQVLYVSNISGVPQIWRMSSAGGYQHQVTFDTNGVDATWWSPVDPTLMVLSAAPGGSERNQLYFANPYGGDWEGITDDGDAVNTFGCWSEDGSRFAYATNSRNKKDFDIYEFRLDSGMSYLLLQGQGLNAAESYSPDNRYLLVTHTESSSNSDILLYDSQTQQTTLRTPHDQPTVHASPRWNGRGTGYYFLTDRGREFSYLASQSLDSVSISIVDTADGDIEQFAMTAGGTWLAWTVNDHGYSRFYMKNLQTEAQVSPARVPQGVIQGLRFSPDGSRLAFTMAAGDRPQDIWMYRTNEDQLLQVTSSATGGIPEDSLRAPELVDYVSFDGRHIPAWWYAPPKGKGRAPIVVAIHGGPEGQARPMLSGLYQFFMSRGYGVLEPNIRGSVGYGKTYEALDNGHLRRDAMRDVEFAARWLKARRDVDSTKLVVFGGSYGGFAALSSITSYPKTWAAGVSIVGIGNFVTFLQNTSAYRRANREAEYGSLAADSALLADLSPYNHVDRIACPVFLIQGANDPRVPKAEAEQMAAAIRARGGTVEYLLFEDEGHGLIKTKNRITAYAALADFLRKYIGK
jgi:dipeptidyl aminopeptidase/acylaminoacyl peptidase